MSKRLVALSLFVVACGEGSSAEAGTEASTEAGTEASTEAGTEPGTAASTETSTDATADATTDATADATTDATTNEDATGTSGAVELPPPDGGLDYQLGGAYPPPAGVIIVSRDRNAAPVGDGVYDICYVNGYQIQPDEERFWLNEHPDLILRDANGDPVIDPDWDEMLLDISTADKRSAIATIVGEWIAGCGSVGFEAVEIDNLDTYSRSLGLLTEDDAVAFMVLLSEAAHDSGLAIAQKNSTELVPRRAEMGTDFVVAEECNRYAECDDYIDGYGDAVLMIEYRAGDFDSGCAAYGSMSIVLRDLDLVAPGDPAYVYDAC